MSALGGFVKVTGWFVWVGAGLLSFFLCLGIISKVAGFWGLVAALILSPVTFLAAPLYAGFAWGNWFPLVLIFGGGIPGLVLVSIGGALSGK